MERFRIKKIIMADMPDDLVLDMAHNMVKDAEHHWFAPSSLTFYMGDIAYNKLIKHAELIVIREIEHEKLFGIKIKRLSSMAINSGTLILESNAPTIDVNSLYTGSIIRGISYDEAFSHIFKMGKCEIEINPKKIKKGNKDAD